MIACLCYRAYSLQIVQVPRAHHRFVKWCGESAARYASAVRAPLVPVIEQRLHAVRCVDAASTATPVPYACGHGRRERENHSLDIYLQPAVASTLRFLPCHASWPPRRRPHLCLRTDAIAPIDTLATASIVTSRRQPCRVNQPSEYHSKDFVL